MREELRLELLRWERDVEPLLRSGALWRLTAYRLARFAAERSWGHVITLECKPLTASVARQLYRALGSTCANLAEGQSRRSAADRARLFEYALGSARECREWYLHGRPVLGAGVTGSALEIIDELVSLLVVYVNDQRRRSRPP